MKSLRERERERESSVSEIKIQPVNNKTKIDRMFFSNNDKMKAVFHEWYFVFAHFDIYYVLNLWITCCVICHSHREVFFFCCRNAFHVFFYKQRRKSYALGRFSLSRARRYCRFTSSPRRLNLIKHSNFQRADYIFLYSPPFQVYSSVLFRVHRDSNN